MAYTAFLRVIAAMKRDVGTAGQEKIDTIISLRRIGRCPMATRLLQAGII